MQKWAQEKPIKRGRAGWSHQRAQTPKPLAGLKAREHFPSKPVLFHLCLKPTHHKASALSHQEDLKPHKDPQNEPVAGLRCRVSWKASPKSCPPWSVWHQTRRTLLAFPSRRAFTDPFVQIQCVTQYSGPSAFKCLLSLQRRRRKMKLLTNQTSMFYLNRKINRSPGDMPHQKQQGSEPIS